MVSDLSPDQSENPTKKVHKTTRKGDTDKGS